jgi:hypothetical protein
VIPSGDVAAAVEPYATAQNTDPFHAIEYQYCDDGKVCAAQVAPSGEVAAAVDDVPETATN